MVTLSKPTITEIAKRLSSIQITKEQKLAQLAVLDDGIVDAGKKLFLSEQALAVLQAVAHTLQRAVQVQLGSITTSALEAVLNDDGYKFKMDFVNRRNNTECDLIFESDGHELKPFDDSGFGAIDIASFALRVSFWRFSKTRNILLFDEPFRNLSRTEHRRMAEMVKRLCEAVGVQMIVVSHIPELAEVADTTFTVVKRNKISEVV